MMAGLFLTSVFRWRSRQLSLALSSAPTNHFECGKSQSSNFCQGLRNTKSWVSRFQKVSGDSKLSRYSSWYLARLRRARSTNSGLGSKVRVSVECDSMDEVSSDISCRIPGKN